MLGISDNPSEPQSSTVCPKMSEKENEDDLTPPDIIEIAKATSENLLPKKSKQKYLIEYTKFMQWRKAKNTKSLSENVLLAYFTELSKDKKPSTLWAIYSMIRTTLIGNNNINIAKYTKLRAFLKKQSTGFISKKSKILSADNISKFLKEAPDEKYLATKVAMILGISGACRREELYNMNINDIQDNDSELLVNIPRTKNNKPRFFTVTGEFYDIFKKYTALRPNDAKNNKLFLNYQNGKCTHQTIGINKFGSMPKQIATYLQLPDANSYTGHTFRRTSATLLVDSGADITTLKRHGGWKSNQVAEGYIENSIHSKNKISAQITQRITSSTLLKQPKNDSETNLNPSSSKINDVSTNKQNLEPSPLSHVLPSNIFNISNCHVTIFPGKQN